MIPKLKLVLEYKHFFDSEPPENRLDLIKHIPKLQLLYEIAGLNYRLKPYNQLKYDFSLETQTKELEYFCPIDKDLYKKYVQIASKYTKSKDEYPLIFNRAANLFALEEILNNDGFLQEEKFDMKKVEVWDGIFKYLLAVNAEVVKVKQLPPEDTTIENISASAIALNELMIEDNPVYIPYKGICLIEYLSKHPVYGNELQRYFNETLKIDKDRFIYNLLSLSMANSQKKSFTEFVYNTNEPDAFLDFLSSNQFNNRDFIKLLTVKKTPFYKDRDTRYIVLDINFLINKSYNFFINDFWFDYLKPQKDEKGKDKFSFKHYRAAFGLFFEEYVGEIIENSFHHLKYPKPLLFDNLKIKVPAGQIEVADIYVRQNKKILVGQVKSSSIYDNEKYSGEINTLYRNNREQFYKDFGVNQTYDSIKTILENSDSFDSKLPVNKRLEFYPIIVVNDKVFQTPLIPNLLHQRFQELLANDDYKPHKIHPLVVAQISDLEYLENTLAKKKKTIWDILKSHYKKIDKTLMPPLIQTTDRFINPGIVAERLMIKMKEIINTYSERNQ
ncbi:hypothetical protein [Alkaliflexus imshenetskii]|uniref:hypothetical protein n=1 Tax=Alkaliflexus imshenetskii TaxID=286730 RepID=UPI00047D4842|nr:hypothetical protein [Alkaliflexus imshenetskii]